MIPCLPLLSLMPAFLRPHLERQSSGCLPLAILGWPSRARPAADRRLSAGRGLVRWSPGSRAATRPEASRVIGTLAAPGLAGGWRSFDLKSSPSTAGGPRPRASPSFSISPSCSTLKNARLHSGDRVEIVVSCGVRQITAIPECLTRQFERRGIFWTGTIRNPGSLRSPGLAVAASDLARRGRAAPLKVFHRRPGHPRPRAGNGSRT